MPDIQIPVKSTDDEIYIDESADFVFGEYLRAVRKAREFSIRQFAKAVGKTPTYISDIEHGNNNPPEKELLDRMIAVLNLTNNPKVKARLYDLAAEWRNDIPVDVKDFLMGNRTLLTLIRNIKDMPNREQMLSELAEEYGGGSIDG